MFLFDAQDVLNPSTKQSLVFSSFAQPPALNFVMLYHYIGFFITTIITLVAKSATLDCV